MTEGGIWNDAPMLRGEAVALFGGAPGGDWLGSEEGAAPLVVQAVAAVARFVLAGGGRLLVPPEPAIATLVTAIAQDFHAVPPIGVESQGDEGTQSVVLVPWPPADRETPEAMVPFFPADLVSDRSRGPEDLVLRDPEFWPYGLEDILRMAEPLCALFVGGGEASLQALEIVARGRLEIQTGLFISAGGAAAMAPQPSGPLVTRIEEDEQILAAMRDMELVTDTVVDFGPEEAEPEAAPEIEPYVPYAALAQRFLRRVLDRKRPGPKAVA